MTVEHISPRIASAPVAPLDTSVVLEAIEEFGATQRVVAEALRETVTRIRSTADDTNQRIRALEEAVYGMRELLRAR